MGLIDSGEVLLDNISVLDNSAGDTQLIQNGNFTGDTIGGPAAKWRIQGTHIGTVVADPITPGNQVLDLVATAHMHYLSNHAETMLVGNVAVANGHEYKISFDAKWVSGSPQFRTELYYNDAAETVDHSDAGLSGTPAVSTQPRDEHRSDLHRFLAHASNAGSQRGDHGLRVGRGSRRRCEHDALVSRRHRRRQASMTAAGGGKYQGTIPGQAAASVINFYVEGADSLGAIYVSARGPKFPRLSKSTMA